MAAAANPITLTDAALAHLHKLRAESGGDSLLLRMGVKSGGCSGMSYVVRGGALAGAIECAGQRWAMATMQPATWRVQLWPRPHHHLLTHLPAPVCLPTDGL